MRGYLTAGDFERLAKASGYFARKFSSEKSSALLEMIDSELLQS
jgi:hypothetical protein